MTIARQQQQQGWRAPSGVIKPKAPTLREQQRAVLAALPGVGPVLAARLLHHFGGLRGALSPVSAARRSSGWACSCAEAVGTPLPGHR